MKVWVDFENYQVNKVYGYDYQVSPYYKDEIKKEAVVDPKGRSSYAVIVERDFAQRLEGKTPQLYVKTLFGSYHHDREFVEEVDRANWDEHARKRVARREVKLEVRRICFLTPVTIDNLATRVILGHNFVCHVSNSNTYTTQEDPRSYLFKLQKKPSAVERKATWEYNPLNIVGDLPFSKNKDLALYQSDYTDTRSDYTIRYKRIYCTI
jgi:hypothetical protein